MTWGQLRLLLKTGATGISDDLLDEYLNTRYEQILEAANWSGLKYHATVQTTAAYQSSTDSVTLTVGSATVAGSGTAWTSAITGLQFYRPGDTAVYTATYVSGTGLTLDRPYEGNGVDAAGTVYSGSQYVLMQDIYALPADTRAIVECLDPMTGRPMDVFSAGEMDASCGPRTRVADPAAYAAYGDSDESAPPVLHRIRFYPPPLRARGVPITYIHAATGFTGTNTQSTPLPWVSASALLAGCRASIETYLATQSEGAAAGIHLAAARVYAAEFAVELNRLLLVEHTQRRKIVAVKMASRFTRHRLARATQGRNWGPGQGGPN